MELVDKLNASKAQGITARRFKIKRAETGSWALLPPGCLDDCAAAASVSQRMVFWMGRNSRRSIRLGWPGRGWQGYSSLGVLEGSS